MIKKHLLLKTMLLLCALVTGSGTMWADDATFDWTSTGNMGSKATGKVNNISLTGAANSASNAPAVTSNTLRIYAHRSSGNGASATFTADTGYKITAIEVRSSNGGSILKYAIDGGDTYSGFSFSSGVATITDLDVSSITLKNCQNSGSSNTTIQISKVVITYASASSTPSSGVAFAYATRSLDLKDGSSFTQTATTADGYAETDGASVTYSMTANTAGATINTSTGEVTPTKAGSVTIQASATAITGEYLASTASYTLTVTDTRVFTVTCHTGNTSSNVDRTSGATLNLDNPAAICGMSFVGWSSSNNAASPTWVANTTKVTGNMELYAMYQEVAGQYSYHLVEASQSDWRGDYLIAYNSTTFADGRVGGTSTGGMGASGIKVNPTDNLSGKIVNVSWGDSYSVTIEAIDNEKLSSGYLMKTKDGKYNYQTNNSNGLSATDTRATAANYPLSITYNSSSDIDIANSAGAIFHYNTDGFFRFYKDGGQNNIYLYKRTEDVTPVYSLGLTEAVAVSSIGLATYASNFDLDFTNVSGLEAYIAKEESSTIKLYQVEKVPAGTGVLLRATNDGTNFNVPLFTSTADDMTGNIFVRGTGAAVATQVSTTYNYILNNVGGVVGFYRANGQTVATNRAYLATSLANARVALNFDEDETTSISEMGIKNNEIKATTIYDLQGRKVENPTRGLYIVNGKKVVIK